MLKTVSNGQSIHQYIPPHLKRMFYNNPAAVHASQNGVDPYGFPTDGLVLYLPLWALQDSAFQSIDPYRHTCTVTGTTWGTQGRTFDGASEILQATLLDTMPASNELTFMCWAYFNASGSQEYLMSKTNIASEDRFQFKKQNTDKLNFFVEGSNGGNKNIDSAASIVAQTWNHCVGVYKAGSPITVYLNTVATAGVNADTVRDGSALDFSIGSSNGGFFLTGKIWDVLIYNRALSAGEIQHNYNCTKWRY